MQGRCLRCTDINFEEIKIPYSYLVEVILLIMFIYDLYDFYDSLNMDI